MSIKIDRIESNMERQISYILANDIKDNNIKFVTITGCKVTNDLSFAKIYFTILNEKYKDETLKAVKNATGYIRHELASTLDIRHIPELDFIYDESIEYGKRIENIIENINEEDKANLDNE